MGEYKISKEIHKDPFIYSLGMCLFLFSTVLGHSILINILGRTPKLFWVEISEVIIFYIFIMRFFLLSKLHSYKIIIFKEENYLFLYILVILLGLLKTPPYDYLKMLASFKIIMLGIGGYILARIIMNSRNLVFIFPKIISVTSLLFFLQFIYSFYSNYGFVFISNSHMHSYISTYWGRSNTLAAFFAILFALELGVFFSEKMIGWKVLAGTMSIFCFFSIILISSRAAFLAIIIGLLFFIIFFPTKLSKKLVLFIFFSIIFLLCISIIGGYFFSRWSSDSIERQFALDISDSNSLGRGMLWKVAWDIFLENPLIGGGISNKGFFTREYTGIYYSTSHNFIFQSLADTGLIGTFFLLIFYISIIYKGFKIIRSKFLNKQTRYIVAGIETALVVGFINSFFEPVSLYEPYRALFWFCLGTINIIYYLNYSKKAEIKK